MAAITGTTVPNEPTDRIEHYGQWWLPETDDVRVGGALIFTPEEGPVLTVAGRLAHDDEQPPAIVGLTTSNEYVSIFSPRWQGSSSVSIRKGTNPHILEEVPSKQVWRGSTVAYGLYPDGEQTTFDYIEVRSPAVSMWIGRPRPRVDHVAGENQDIQITLERQDAITCSLGDANLSIHWNEQSKTGSGEAQVWYEPCIAIIPTSPLTLDKAWELYLNPILFFVTLATGTAPHLVQLAVSTAYSTNPGSIPRRVLPTVWNRVKAPSRPPWSGEYLVPFEAVEASFEQVMLRWFEIEKQTRTALLEFFSVPFTPTMYEEESFARTVRACEMWHRAHFGGQYMSDDKFGQILNALTQAVAAEDRSFVNVRMQFANELTLKQRLDDMITRADTPLTALRDQCDRFTRRIVNKRNELTHGSVQSPSLDDDEMAWALYPIQAMFYSNLLRELGYGADFVSTATGRTPAWRVAEGIPRSLRSS
jgi:ApeA N-terminal domain 1